MFYSIWLLAAALAGWAGGKITGNDGFGTLADILLRNHRRFRGSKSIERWV